eukprot:315167_1
MIVNSERDANVSFTDSTVTNIQNLNAQEAHNHHHNHNHNHNHNQININNHINITTTKTNPKKRNKKRKSHPISTESNEPPNKKKKTSNKILKSKLNTKVKQITKNTRNNERKYISKQFKESLIEILQPGT